MNDLRKLAEPFALEDIEWRVSRSGTGKQGVFAMVLAYCTARAIQKKSKRASAKSKRKQLLQQAPTTKKNSTSAKPNSPVALP